MTGYNYSDWQERYRQYEITRAIEVLSRYGYTVVAPVAPVAAAEAGRDSAASHEAEHPELHGFGESGDTDG